jgi:hypothetical protein
LSEIGPGVRRATLKTLAEAFLLSVLVVEQLLIVIATRPTATVEKALNMFISDDITF